MADFSDVREEVCQRKAIPADCTRNASHTFVLQSVVNEIKMHGRSSMHHEVCGVLLGTLCFDEEPYLLIDARIEGRYATCQSGSVTFTSETWDYINGEKDSKFPDKRIVGWYHTHPGFGIFLSNMDAFIHNNFFPQKWQPAYVFDPQAETDGFFFSTGDSLLQEDVVIVPDESPVVVEPKMLANAARIEVLTEEEEGRQSSRRFWIIILSVILFLLVVVDVFGYFIVSDKIAVANTYLKQIENLEKRLREQEADNVRLRTALDSVGQGQEVRTSGTVGHGTNRTLSPVWFTFW